MKGIIPRGWEWQPVVSHHHVVNKQLLPVYDKPMIYYPLSTLMLAGIREILIISTPTDLPLYQRLLGDGKQWGMEFCYAEQPRPEGLAQAFLIGREFLGDSPACLILGDNIFYGMGLPEMLSSVVAANRGGTIFAYRVKDPQRYGIVEFDEDRNVLSLEEEARATEIELGGCGVCTSMTRTSAISRLRSNHPLAASWKSPISTRIFLHAAS